MELAGRIDAFVEAHKEDMFRDIGALVSAKSVQEAPVPGAPFGPGVRRALDTALGIARGLGLAAGEDEGYMGWAEVQGQSERQIATIAHLDVVPEGEGWDADPFTLVRREGWLIGRGVEDDKGPAVLTLYAAKFLREYYEGTPPYTFRALLGCNEESGMADVRHYMKHAPQPAFCFTPDSDWPVCNGEKGHFGGRFVSPRLEGRILDFTGGIAGNVIPDRASCLVRAEALRSRGRVSVEQAGDGTLRLTATGVGGHAAHPAGTVNAIGELVCYLLEENLCEGAEREYLLLLQKLHTASDGSGLGIACRDEVFDPLTIIGGTIEMRGGVIVQGMDSRFPTCTSGPQLAEKLTALAKQHGATLEADRADEPFYIKADSAPIQALLQSYELVAGQAAKTYTMGGGTYARHFDQAVSFGLGAPASEERPCFVGPIHGANEGVSEENLVRGLKIYIHSLVRLMELEY